MIRHLSAPVRHRASKICVVRGDHRTPGTSRLRAQLALFAMLAMVAVLLLPAPLAQADTGWQTAPALPQSLYGLAATKAADGSLYAIGGADGSNNASSSVYSFMPGSNTSWQAAPFLPLSRYEPAATTGSDGSLYLIGGAFVTTVYRYNPGTDRGWQQIAASLPAPRFGLAATTGPDGTLYAIGGADNSNPPVAQNTVYRYNPTTDSSWQPAPALPAARSNLAAVTGSDGSLYAIGGIDGGFTAQSTVYRYNPATDTGWQQIAASLPAARGYLAATIGSDGTLYAIGGLDAFNFRQSTVYRYKPGSDNAWQTAPSLPTARYNLAATTGSDGTLYAIGGQDTANNAQSTVYSWKPVTDTTAPTTSLDSQPANPTNATTASFTFHATDPDNTTGFVFACSLDSGAFAACSSPASYTSLTQGTHAFKVHATDPAGNQGPDANGTWLVDTTPPAISAAATTQPNANGWYKGTVTVHFTCTDNLAGIGAGACPADQLLSSEGSAVSSTAQSVTDLAGNSSAPSNVVTVAIDKTPPTLSGAATTAPNRNGWYNGDVAIVWTCADALSGINGSCPATSMITGEGAALTASASVSDKAGNATLASSGAANIDRTPPVTMAQAPGGWTNADVEVSFATTDNLSGVQTTTYILDGGSPQTFQPGSTVGIAAEGVHTLQFWSVDKAGNTEAPHTVQVKVDKTAPTITNGNSPATNAGGWSNQPVTISFTCADALSGLASCDGATPASPTTSMTISSPPVQTEGLGQLVIGTAVDNASNTAIDPVVLNIDETPPTITGSILPAPNAAGWNNSAVTVAFTCADPKNASNGTAGSGIASCPAPTALNTEGSRQVVMGTAADSAGNSTSATVSNINIDKTPPTITFSGQTPAANANGWNTTPVTVTWTCADSLSGAVSPSTSATVSGDGADQVATGTCTDRAGNTVSATRASINIDRTPPSLAPSVSPNPVLLGGSATASPNATDALSGVASQSCGSVDTTSVGNHTLTCTATDRAGNTASSPAAYAVAYGQKLVYNTTTLYKSGTTIPIALQLLNANGKNISSASIPVTAVAVVNSGGAVVKTINAAFVFSNGQGQYNYSLDTTGLSSGSYALRFTAGNDPTVHPAPFNIK